MGLHTHAQMATETRIETAQADQQNFSTPIFIWLLLLLSTQPAKSRDQQRVPMTAPFFGRFSQPFGGKLDYFGPLSPWKRL